MTIAFLIAKATIIVLIRKLNHARFDINSLDYLFKQAQLVDYYCPELRVVVRKKGITVNEKPLSEYKKALLAKLKDKLDSVSVLSQSIKQLEEHSEIQSTMDELDKELRLSTP